MKIWLMQPSEIMPLDKNDSRLLRTGMMAEELSKKGHEIMWFSATFDHFQKKQLFDENTIVKLKDNYYIYLIHSIKYKRNISISRIINHKLLALKFRKIANKLEKPDLIYVSFPTIDYAEEAIRYGKKNNVPVIVDIRDLWPDIFNHNLHGIVKIAAKPYIWYMDYKTKKIMKNATAINSISDAMLNWGLRKGKREKTNMDRTFYIGYDKKDTVVKENDKIILNAHKFNISFFATINNQFDYKKIVDIAKRLELKDKDIVINICGTGPKFDELKKLASEVTNIKLHGWLGKQELITILENSKMGLAPYNNTFDFQMSVSNKFCEYTSYGLPLILTTEGYMKELIEENNCGVASLDSDYICEYILMLKNDNKKYNEIALNAKKLYDQKFVAKQIYKELVEYLEELKEEKI